MTAVALIPVVAMGQDDSWIKQATLTASDGEPVDLFGGAVAIRDDMVMVGASSAGVDDHFGQGAVYLYTRAAGGVWSEQTKLTASDGASGDAFGTSVALGSDTAVIGAQTANVDGTNNQGAAYVFSRDGGTWSEQTKLVADDGAQFNQFGSAVALEDDTVLVGAVLAGAVYVFTRNGQGWVQEAKLVASDGAGGDFFGGSIVLSGDTALIGARQADVDGQGAAYVFTRNAGVWSEQTKLTAADGAANDNFGRSVALLGDTAVVGAIAEVDGNADQGAAYVFTRDGGIWNEQTKLTASDGAAEDFFGISAALTEDRLLIGAAFADIDEHDDQGAAYLFTRDGGTWLEQAKLTAREGDGGAFGDQAGSTVALAGDTALVGAPSANEAKGAAYVFVDPPANVGTVSGTVHGRGYCGAEAAPLAGATVEIAGAQDTYILNTDGNGRYEIFLPDDESPLNITVTAADYLSAEALNIPFAGGDVVVRDFELDRDAPCAAIEPDAFSLELEPDGNAAETLALGNAGGAAPLSWEIIVAEAPAGVTLDCGGTPGLIIHDDGTIEQGYSGNPNTTNQIIFADRFTPDSYPASFHTVCLAWTTFGPTSLDFEVVVFADDGPGGGPGTELGAVAATATDIPPDPVMDPAWVSVDISSLGIALDAGSVFIGARWAPSSPNVFLTADESSGNPPGFAGGFRWSDDTEAWTPIQDAFFEYRSMFVRALAGDPGCDDPGTVSWLSVDSGAGSIPPGGTGEVEVNVDATGLNPGAYRANLCVYSNDPIRPLHVVPIKLTVTIPPDYAILEGTVEGLGYCAGDPGTVGGAEIVIESQTETFSVFPDADGFYRTGLDSADGPVVITASAAEHLSLTVEEVELAAGETTVQDFGLIFEAPCITVQPEQFELELPENSGEAFELMLGNIDGGAALEWTIETAWPRGVAVNCDAGPGLLVHDDGTIENGYSEDPGPAAFVDKFTPSVYPASFDAVCVALITPGPVGQTSLDFEIVVYADDGPGGGPGTELGALEVSADDIPVIEPPIPPGLEPAWFGYDISSLGISIDAGSVFIGARWTPSEPDVFIAADESPSNPVGFAGGYRRDSVDNEWSPIEADPVFGFPNYRSLFVRAGASDPGCDNPGDIPWLVIEPAAGSAPAGGGSAVQVMIDTMDLAPGDYAASLCIISNDPERPLLAVPLTLTVTESAPVINVDPENLATVLPLGQTETQALTVSNLGDAPLVWEIAEIPVFAQVSAGGGHTCAIDDTGVAYCWGSNGNGQLGVDDTNPRLTPAAVAANGMGEVIEIATGWQHTCAVDAGGNAFCWGSNFFGQLGNGDPPIERHIPWPVDQEETGAIIHIAAHGGHTCAINDQRAGFCWGFNDEGNLGDGTTKQRRRPTPIDDSALAAVEHFNLSPFHSCAVDTAGVPYCWGGNSFGQLGDGTTKGRHVPTPVVTDALVAAGRISAGEAHTCAVSTAGEAFCWGLNGDGQLGDGSDKDRHVPVSVDGGLGVAGTISAGGAHTCAVADGGTGYCWGRNELGQLGDGTTVNRPLPAPVAFGLDAACTLPDWVSVDPASGSVPGGGDGPVDVTFDATGLAPGDFEASLCIASNDPERPLVVVPLDFTVLERPEPVDPIFSDRFETTD